MAAPMEVVLSSDISGQMWNSCIWDPHTGTSLMSYKGGSSAPRTLCLLGKDYLIAAVNCHPLLHVWALHRQDQQQSRIVCPGLVTALDTSPCGHYCVAGIVERLHVWHVNTGRLLAVLSRHYQQITCLEFTDDGSHIVSGAEDSLVLVWSMASILQNSSGFGSAIEPVYVWSGHSLPITDLHCGHGGVMSRVASSSLDQTCKLWDLSTGQQLCSFVFNVSITSVTMDTCEYHLFAGGIDGVIYQINLFKKMELNRPQTGNDDKEDQFSLTFKKHLKQISCLSVSMDGTMLLSGSHDQTVVLWDIVSRQCIRILNHKGAVTNAMFIQPPARMFHVHSKDLMPILPFQRTMATENVDKPQPVHMRLKHSVTDEINKSRLSQSSLQNLLQEIDDRPTIPKLHSEIEQLNEKNKKLYTFTVNKILQNVS